MDLLISKTSELEEPTVGVVCGRLEGFAARKSTKDCNLKAIMAVSRDKLQPIRKKDCFKPQECT